MKEPRRPMSSTEFSCFVVRLCVVLGCVAMIIVLCTSGRELTWKYEIPVIIGMAMVIAIGVFSFVFDFLKAKERDDDEK